MFVSGFVLAGLGIYAAIVGSIWFLGKAFSVHIGWGLASLLIAPVALVFAVKHWGISWRPLALNIAGSLGAVGGAALLAVSVANEAGAGLEQNLEMWNQAAGEEVSAEPTEAAAP